MTWFRKKSKDIFYQSRGKNTQSQEIKNQSLIALPTFGRSIIRYKEKNKSGKAAPSLQALSAANK